MHIFETHTNVLGFAPGTTPINGESVEFWSKYHYSIWFYTILKPLPGYGWLSTPDPQRNRWEWCKLWFNIEIFFDFTQFSNPYQRPPEVEKHEVEILLKVFPLNYFLATPLLAYCRKFWAHLNFGIRLKNQKLNLMERFFSRFLERICPISPNLAKLQ